MGADAESQNKALYTSSIYGGMVGKLLSYCCYFNNLYGYKFSED